jgi:WD40 repeat protein
MSGGIGASALPGAAAAAWTVVVAACAAAPPMPDLRSMMTEMPTAEQVVEMTERSMGRPKLPEAADPNQVQVVFQTGHASAITAVALSADGRYVLSSAWDETAKLWDVASGREVRTFIGVEYGTRTAAFVAGADRIVLGGVVGAKLIDSRTGQVLPGTGGIGASTIVSSGGRFAARLNREFAIPRPGERLRAAEDTGISVVELATDRVIATLPTGNTASPLALSDDGKTVLVRRLHDLDARKMTELARAGRGAFPESRIESWDVGARKRLRELPIPSADFSASAVAIMDPGGRRLVVENLDQTLAVYDVASGERRQTLAGAASQRLAVSNSLVFSPDGRLLARATQEGAIHVWELSSGRIVKELEGTAVNFSADGRKLVAGSAGGGAPFLHDLESGEEQRLASAASAITDLALVDDGRAIVAATESGGARLWDLASGELLRTFACAGGFGAYSVSVSAARPWLATGCMDGAVHVWNLRTGERLRSLLTPLVDEFAFTVARFDATGRRLVVGRASEITLFDAATGQALQRATLPDGPLPPGMDEAATNALGQLSGSQREAIESAQSDPGTRQAMQAIRALDFHPDGKRVAVAKGGLLLLWDAGTGQIAQQFGHAEPGAAPTPQQRPESPPEGSPNAVLDKLFSGKRLSKSDRKALEGLSRRGGGAAVLAPDPSSIIDQFYEQMGLDAYLGVTGLAFSADGALLHTLGANGRRSWDVASGRELRRARASSFDAGSFDDPMAAAEQMMDLDVATGGGLALSADGRLGARGFGRTVELWDLASGSDVAELIGHTSDVTSVAFLPRTGLLASGSRDGAVRLWALPQGKPVAQLIALGASDFVTVTDDQFYRASRRGIGGVAFRFGGQLYPFEQFDLRFNRPDVVLERLGQAPPELVQRYRLAYERRLRKLGLGAASAAAELHLPQVALAGEPLPASTTATRATLRVRATDEKYPLDRINIFVNDVPVLGTAGLPIANREAREHEQSVEVPLLPGRNKLQVSVLNQLGVESLRQTVYTTSTAPPAPPDVYIVAIGVSRYRHEAYNLRFAAKDAADLLGAYRALAERGAVGRVHVLELTNERATRSTIRDARAWLARSRPTDLVVVFAAGHGMTDARSNYFFGTHDIDPERPEVNGLPYEDFEALLDGIPALQKVLLIDTCFSGEIEEDEPTAVAQNIDTGGAGTVSMRAFKASRGVAVVADDAGAAGTGAGALSSGDASGSGGVDVVRFQQELFADLRRGTGAVVISSASGNEYALEGEQWANGVFTYALLDGLKNGRADADGNSTINVSELQAYVIEEVRRLTAGGQNPTVRRENLEHDFVVYR